VRKDVKVGTVGGEYTEISSGVDLGQRVILADMAQPVPTSNTSTSFRGGGLCGAGLGGGAGGFGGSRLSGGFGGASQAKSAEAGSGNARQQRGDLLLAGAASRRA